jgi:hypothetical protein
VRSGQLARYAQILLVVDVSIGALLLVAIGAAAVRPTRRRSPTARRIGALLVALPLPLAVALRIVDALPPNVDQAVFALGVVAFAAGAFLLLGGASDDWQRPRDDGPEPAWWPDFERPFRAHVDELSRRREGVKTR